MIQVGVRKVIRQKRKRQRGEKEDSDDFNVTEQEDPLSITPDDPTFNAGAGPEEFTITRTGDLGPGETVYVSTTDPYGDNTDDFIPLYNVPVTFDPDSDTATFDIDIENGGTSGETKTFGIDVTDTSDDDANTLTTDDFNVVESGQPTAGGLGCPHFTTFDGIGFWYQGAGEYIAAQSTVPGDTFQVQMRIEPEFGINSSVSIITQIAVQVGNDRVTFDPNRAADTGTNGYANPVSSPGNSAVVWVDGQAISLSQSNPVYRLTDGTITLVSQYEYVVSLNTGESVTVDPFGDGMGLSIALPLNAAHGSVQGFFGSYMGQADSFALPNGTSLGPDLSQDELYQTFANAWRVTDADSILDYAPGQTTETFTSPGYPNQVLTLADFPADLVAEAAAVVAAAGITDPTLAADAEFDYITMGDPSFVTEDAEVASLNSVAGRRYDGRGDFHADHPRAEHRHHG